VEVYVKGFSPLDVKKTVAFFVGNLPKKLLLVVVIELLDHPITPRFPRGDKPGLHVMVETKAD